MSFLEEDFVKLSGEDRTKKLVSAIHGYFNGLKNERYTIDLVKWYNSHENYNLTIPENYTQWKNLQNELLKKLHKINPFIQETPYDNSDKKREIIPVNILLNDIRSPYNAGAVFRTSEAFGVEKIFLCGITPDPDKNNKVLKTAKNVNVEYLYIENPLDVIKEQKKAGYTICCLEKTNNSIEINRFTHSSPVLIILGNEEFGLSYELLKSSDFIYHINMHGAKNSLNVSVAFGIALFEISGKYYTNHH